VPVAPSRELLAGGYRNQVWKVRAGRGFVIEKQYAEDPGSPNPMYPNLPDHEAAAMAHLAGTGCAPELVSYRPPEHHHGAQVVYRYVTGTQWMRGVEDVARLLSTVHHLQPPRGLRRLHRSATEALAHADVVVADTPSVRSRSRMADARPDGMVHRPARRPSLVHTDCGPGNIVRTRYGLVLIDWQCPGVGDPVEDIACFLSPAMMILYATTPHTAAARQAFLDAYGDEQVVRRYLRDGPAWHFRIASYCVWRAHRLARHQPEVAARYRTALDAELELLAAW
jgi:aminoglycoside phosphotransferase (APT) family kinase protein